MKVISAIITTDDGKTRKFPSVEHWMVETLWDYEELNEMDVMITKGPKRSRTLMTVGIILEDGEEVTMGDIEKIAEEIKTAYHNSAIIANGLQMRVNEMQDELSALREELAEEDDRKISLTRAYKELTGSLL